MFERRLKIILAIPLLFGIVIVARLYDLQVANGEMYQEKAEAALLSPKQFLPPLRGRILDRTGLVLVSDEPAHDLCVHYGVLSEDKAYLDLLARQLRRESPAWAATSDEERASEIQLRIQYMWETLADLSNQPLQDLLDRRAALCHSVRRLKYHIFQAWQRQGRSESLESVRLREEESFHPMLRDISPDTRTRIEVELANMPFLRIEPSVRRQWLEGSTALCHVLGNLGEVSAEMIDDDPDSADWLSCYRAGDLVGTSGIEYVCEPMLRGKRGYEERNLDRELIEHVPPIDGLDVQLTIDLDMQQKIADILAEAVHEQPDSAGASCVVIDVETREIIALVSVPTYDRDTFQKHYASLRDDSCARPLLFRAVSEEYQPGSILKPVALAAGFSYGMVDANKRVHCTGEYIPGSSKWHCWTFWRGMPGHGYINAEEAIQHSCNVYFYGLGEQIGAPRLTRFYRTFIRGPEMSQEDALGRHGTGLIEERDGLIPDAMWLQEYQNRQFTTADGRNYAIGQGEIQLTPLQAANIFATLATGKYQSPTLIANDGLPRPQQAIEGISDATWRLIRRGLYRCVNEPGGTAYNHARLPNLEVCGKTGSAQCVSRIAAYRYTFKNSAGVSQTILATTPEAAREALDIPPDVPWEKRVIAERWPPPDPQTGKVPTHAWFAGFAPYQNPKIALAVIVEYGGSGGRTAGPVGKAIFEALLDSPCEYLGFSSNAEHAEEAQ